VAKKSNIPVIALTPGEPAGVGPDLAIQLAQQPPAGALVLIADPALLAERAKLLHLPFAAREWKGRESAGQGVYLLPVKTACPVTAGRLDTANAVYVIETLKSAVAGCTDGDFDALVTGPVHKGNINDAKIAFTGHTEFLAEASGAAQPVMLLAAPGLRVALVTTHLPLAEVPRAITRERLTAVIEVLHADLQRKFGIADPVILVCGPQPACGRIGAPGPRGNRRDRTGDANPPPRRLCVCAARCRRIPRSRPVPASGRCRRGAGHVSRSGSAGAQARTTSPTPSTSRWDCRSCAPRWITARRWNSPAPAARMSPAWSPPSKRHLILSEPQINADEKEINAD
jgi:hypothetical protein